MAPAQARPLLMSAREYNANAGKESTGQSSLLAFDFYLRRLNFETGMSQFVRQPAP